MAAADCWLLLCCGCYCAAAVTADRHSSVVATSSPRALHRLRLHRILLFFQLVSSVCCLRRRSLRRSLFVCDVQCRRLIPSPHPCQLQDLTGERTGSILVSAASATTQRSLWKETTRHTDH